MSHSILKKTSNTSLPPKHFRKRSLNWKILGRTMYNLILDSKNALRFSKLNKEFMERIMLAVTSVNECRYCSFFHTQVALESGCSEDEIREILDGDFNCVNQTELPALAFAQHFAESQEYPSKDALKQLIRVYGINKAQGIITACRMITLGNLFGNSIDAYIHRYHGIIPEDGSPVLEGFIYYISAMIVMKMRESFTKKP